MKIIAGGLIVGLMALALACGGGGEEEEAERDSEGIIVIGGEIETASLRVGDCVQDWEEDPEEALRLGMPSFRGPIFSIASVVAVPCSEPHDNEVFSVIEVPSEEEFHPPFALNRIGNVECFPSFEPYVGREVNRSPLDIFIFHPSEESWSEEDNRKIVCLLYDGQLEPLVGSMRGSGEPGQTEGPDTSEAPTHNCWKRLCPRISLN